MVMRSIPELLNDSSSHISIAIPRHLMEGLPLSSSSDSDEDIDEIPFIPMPLNMEFSGSRISLNDIQTKEDEAGKQNGTSKWSGSHFEAQEIEMTCDSNEMDKEGLDVAGKGHLNKKFSHDNDRGSSNEESSADLTQKSDLSRKPLRKGSSMECDKPEDGQRRGELRRGCSADSALLLRITPEEGVGEVNQEDGRRILKKAVSMELPKRSTSPGAAKLSQEDYAHKLELMRQRLLRGASVDNKMSGLRGPLLETLGMGDEKRAISSDRYSRTSRLGPPPTLTRAASSDFPRDEVPKPKVLRKSTSFSQGDPEPIPLHRRFGAPLEIPLAQVEDRRLKEAISMSALTEQIKLDSRPVTPRESSPKPQGPESVTLESSTKTESEESLMEMETKPEENINEKMDGLTTDSNFDERSSTSGLSEKDMSISEELKNESEFTSQRISIPPLVVQSSKLDEKMETEEEGENKQDKNEIVREAEERVNSVVEVTEERVGEEVNIPVKSSEMTVSTSSVMVRPTQAYSHSPGNVVSSLVTPLIPARAVLPDGRTSAYASIMQTIMVPSLHLVNDSPLGLSIPVVLPDTSSPSVSNGTYLPASISSDLPGPPKLVIMSTTEHPAVYSRVASPEMITKEPSPPNTIIYSPSPQELSAESDLKDISSEEVFEARFKKRESSLSRSLKFLSWSKTDDKSRATLPDSTEIGEEIYRPRPVGAPLELVPRALEEKSKSVQDLREAQKDQGFMRRLSMRLKRSPSMEHNDEMTKEEDSVTRRRLSWTLGLRGSQEKKEAGMIQVDVRGDKSVEYNEKELKKPNESPVLAMRRKIESTVSGISTRIRSYSEERKASEEKEQKRTPILSMLRRSTSESRAMKVPSIHQNPLASQANNAVSSESLDSVSSLKSDTSKGMEQNLVHI